MQGNPYHLLPFPPCLSCWQVEEIIHFEDGEQELQQWDQQVSCAQRTPNPVLVSPLPLISKKQSRLQQWEQQVSYTVPRVCHVLKAP